MGRKTFIVLPLFLCCFISNKFYAQSVGVNLTAGIPVGEFKNNLSNNIGGGISLQFLLWDPNPALPYALGFDGSYIIYGYEVRTEPVNEGSYYDWVDINRTNSLVKFHLLFQIAPPKGDIKPELELLFGGSYIFTTTNFDYSGFRNDVESSTDLNDFAWSVGIGGGVMFKLTDITGLSSSEQKCPLYLDVKGRYLYGTNAKYLKPGSVKIVNNNLYYDIMESKTALMTINVGVILYVGSFHNRD